MSTAQREVLADIDNAGSASVESAARVVLRDGVPRLLPTDASRWLATLGELVGQPVRVTLTRQKAARSAAMNRLLWGPVYGDILAGLRQLAVEAGERCPFASKDDLHSAMKYLILGSTVTSVPRRRAGAVRWDTIELPSTTTKLTSEQFSAYIEGCCRWAAERGVYVRQPGEEISA